METDSAFEADEHCVWTGVPRQGIFLRSTDKFQIPVTLLIAGPMLIFSLGLFGQGDFFIAGLLAAIALYLLVGRFCVDARIRARTVYQVTNKRIIARSGFIFTNVMTLPVRDISESDLSLQLHPDGTGSISFLGAPRSAESSLAMRWPRGVDNGIILDHVSHPEHVRGLIRHAMKMSKHKTG